jgi:hypothetical protein
VNILECITTILATHREARRWTDDVVAADIVARLGLDPAAVAMDAKARADAAAAEVAAARAARVPPVVEPVAVQHATIGIQATP